MKKRFYIIIYVIITLILSSFPIQYVQAASGSINATAGSSSVVVGGTVKVTVRVSSASEIGSWRFDLDYDSSKLSLSPSSSPASVVGYFTSIGQKTASYSYTFTALASGNTTVSVRNAAIVGIDENFMSVTSSGTNINVLAQSNQPNVPNNLSANNNLASLSVEGLNLAPIFNKGVQEYSLDLEPDTENINILAVAEDSKAIVTGGGQVFVLDGINRLEVKVTAENGNEKIYVINALVKELDPIEVMIGNKKYTVIKKTKYMEAPYNYVETTATINNKEVPAYRGEITKFTLVGLKSETGELALYVYDEINETFTLYRELKFINISFYPYPFAEDLKIPKGYEKFILKIENEDIDAYRLNKGSKFSLIYGMNVETGSIGLYRYDSEEGSLQRYDEDESLYYNDIQRKNLILIIILASALTATSLLSVIMIIRNKKLKNKQVE